MSPEEYHKPTKGTQSDNTCIGGASGLVLIALLKKLSGAIPYDGDCSVQVAFRLANGETIRFGVSDHDDEFGASNLWVDQYPGLAVVGGDPLGCPTMDELLFIHREYAKMCKDLNHPWPPPTHSTVAKETTLRFHGFHGCYVCLNPDGTYHLSDPQ